MSYSQNDEERFILAACAEEAGRFLDVGAWEAIDKSNTRALYERAWSGVLVEPSPVPFAALKAVYGASPRVSLIQAAVVLDPTLTEVQMYISDDMVSTTEFAHYQLWKDTAVFTGCLVVVAVTLEKIFQEYGDFDFVNLDTEGTSVDLLRWLLEMGKRPKCICVEYNDRHAEALSAATACGYACVYMSAENLVLVWQ